MTNEEVRDELARLAGWVPIHEDTDIGRWRWQKTLRTGDVDKREDHPCPPTLDGADGAVPYGWTWCRWAGFYRGYYGGYLDRAMVKVVDNGRGHEMEDLYTLALACVRAEEKAVAK